MGRAQPSCSQFLTADLVGFEGKGPKGAHLAQIVAVQPEFFAYFALYLNCGAPLFSTDPSCIVGSCRQF